MKNNKSAFTPGPWFAQSDGYEGWRFEGGFNGVITSAEGKRVFAGPASFHALRGATPREAKANAEIMAMAPEMLDFIYEVSWRVDIDELRRAAKAILKKAKYTTVTVTNR